MRRAAGVLLAALLTPTLACTRPPSPARSNDQPGTSEPAATLNGRVLRPVELPSLTGIVESVQTQIRERFALFQQRMADPRLPLAEQASEHGEMGKLFLAAELFEAAEVSLNNASLLSRRDMRWPYYLGHLYKQTGSSEKSAVFFEEARRLEPGYFATLIWLGEVYLGRGELDKAEPLLAVALSAQPRSAAALAGLGRVALAKKEFARAIEHLEQSLSINGDAAVVHYAIGMAYRGLGQTEKAEAHLARRSEGDVLVPDPLMQEVQQLLQSASSLESIGIRALANGQPKAAAGYFERAVALAPQEASLHQRLGSALYLVGDPGAAREHFETALRLSPAYAPAHYSLGLLLASSGRYAEAVERFRAAATHDRNYVEPRLQIADILRHTGRAPEALRLYAEVLEIDPRAVDAQLGEALALVALKRYRDAHRRLEEAVGIRPDDAELTHVLARLLASAPDDGIRDGARALRLVRPLAERDGNLERQETMAMALAETGVFDEAVALQRRLIEAAGTGDRADLVGRLEANLKRYERRQPSRSPWPPDQLP